LGEKLRESSTSDSEDLESLAGFLLLLMILNAADQVISCSVANQDQVISLESTSQAAGATLDSQPADSSIKHAPVMHATSSASVASNTHLVAPVVTNNPLTITPSHGRYLLPTEKIERLSKKPTRAQVVQVTTNLKRDSCHYLPIDVVLRCFRDVIDAVICHEFIKDGRVFTMEALAHLQD
jgi:hypothetical protein